MVDGNVEESLNLRGVQIDEERAVGAGGGEQIGDEFCADGDAGTVLAILARVSIIGNYGGDAGCGGALECVDHDQQFHQILVDGIAGGLHDKDVDAANVLEQLEVDFAISEALQLDLSDGNADVAADLFRQGTVGRAAEELEAPVLAEIASTLAFGSRFGILRHSGSGWAACSRHLCWRRPYPVFVCLPTFPSYRSRFHRHQYLQAGWLWLHSGSCRLRKLAGRLGFEPRQVPPKGTVLPLDDRPTALSISAC